ncbi:unnamed protein product [Jaminaea pallidilutea]
MSTATASSSSSSGQRRVVIVGGGIMGASTLYSLVHSATPPQSLTLVEAASTVAPGASGKSGGFLARDWHGPATSSIADLSFRLHRELAERDNGREKWGYRDVETLSVEFDSGKTRNKAPKAIQDWVDGKHVSRSSVMGGSGSTAQATPLPLVEHLVESSKSKAAEKGIDLDILLNTYATKANLDAGGSTIESVTVEPSNGGGGGGESQTLPCTDVVLSAGPWTGSLVSSLFPRKFISSHQFLTSASYIDGSRAHSIVVRGTRPASNHCLFTEMSYGNHKAAAPEVYARSDGTVYICGGSDDVPLPRLAEEVDPDLKKTKALIEQTAALSPDVLAPDAGAKVERQQACYLPVGSRSNLIVSGDKSSGVWVGGGGASCWGITLSLGVGHCMAELMLEGKIKSAEDRMLRG